MNWLRLAEDVTWDHRLRHLPVAQRWAWIGVLTMAASLPPPDGRFPLNSVTVEMLADEANITRRDAGRALEAFVAARLLLVDGDYAEIAGWNQYRPPANVLRLSAEVWAKVRRAVFERDDFTCQYCGERGGRLECDHAIPVSRGGSHDPENLKTACRRCNRSKRAKTPEEWRA